MCTARRQCRPRAGIMIMRAWSSPRLSAARGERAGGPSVCLEPPTGTLVNLKEDGALPKTADPRRMDQWMLVFRIEPVGLGRLGVHGLIWVVCR